MSQLQRLFVRFPFFSERKAIEERLKKGWPTRALGEYDLESCAVVTSSPHTADPRAICGIGVVINSEFSGFEYNVTFHDIMFEGSTLHDLLQRESGKTKLLGGGLVLVDERFSNQNLGSILTCVLNLSYYTK